MIFAFFLLSALIITEYTAQPTTTIIDSKQKDKTQISMVEKKISLKVQPIPIKQIKPSPAKHFEFITLTPVLFDFDQSKLRNTTKKILDEIAVFISDTPGVERLFIEGNTDHIGNNSYNDQLSDRRTASVRKYLLEKGVPETLLSESGYGEIRPVDEYWTRNGKQRNRQVSLHALVNKE